MQDVPGSVLGVTGRQTRNGRTVYEVAFSDGNKYSTFDPNLATKAQQLQGQAVSARVEITQNGQYTNFNLKDIAPQGQLPAMAMPAPAGMAIPIAGVAPAAGIPMQQPAQQGGGKGFTEDDKVRITKLAVLATAFDFVGNLLSGAGPDGLEEGVDLAETLAKRLYEQARAHEVAQPAAQTPQAVAEQVNAVAPGAVAVGEPEQPPAAGSRIPW